MLTSPLGLRWRPVSRRGDAGKNDNGRRFKSLREPISDRDQKRMALGYLQEAWAEALTTESTAIAWRKPACSQLLPNSSHIW